MIILHKGFIEKNGEEAGEKNLLPLFCDQKNSLHDRFNIHHFAEVADSFTVVAVSHDHMLVLNILLMS